MICSSACYPLDFAIIFTLTHSVHLMGLALVAYPLTVYYDGAFLSFLQRECEGGREEVGRDESQAELEES